MLFEIFGFLVSCFIGSVILIYKVTGDIGPIGIKRFLYRIALKNWQKCQAQRMGFYDIMNSKKTADTGIFPCPEEDVLETPKEIQYPNETDEMTFYGIDDNGNGLLVKMSRFYNDITEAILHMVLNGVSYSVSRRGRSSFVHDFVLGNFKLERVESMRSWRIWYNGILRNENNGNSIHVILNFLWKPFDGPVDTRRDINLHLMTEYCTKSGTFGSNLFEFSKILPDGYIQFGAHHGTIRIEGDKEERLYLYGFRSRKWDVLSLDTMEKFNHQRHQLELFGICGSNGNAFRLFSGGHGGWIDGHTLFPSNKKFHITSVDVDSEAFQYNTTFPKLFTLMDQNHSFRIEIWPKFQQQKFQDMDIFMLKLTINGKPGRGILIRKLGHSLEKSRFSSIMETSIISSEDMTEKSKSILTNCNCHHIESRNLDHTPQIISFSSILGQNVQIVGGKGASLAKLFQLSRDSTKFKTAKGFCVTTALFRYHLPLADFKDMFANCDVKDLEQTCISVINRIKSTDAKTQITPLILSWMEVVFGNENVKVAVRSSGILEDGSELSCAGQNKTFLGVLPSEVAEKVVDCWASLFTPQSVQYRLNHGQPAMSEMGVVIQEMVHASAAGVLFTADPRTGNPFQIMISSNYGLGESVVSAACDPDTISIRRSDTSTQLTISERRLGTKKSKIVLNPEGYTTEVEMSNEDSSSYSISNEIAIDLGEIGVRIEKELGELKPVDIEWALDQDGRINILQCRSITSLDAWTDFELIHESDSPYNTTFERLTHANTGEVMPGASSPLSISVVIKLLDVGIQLRSKSRSKHSEPIVPYAQLKTILSRQRILINVLNVMYATVDKEITTALVATDLSIFGHRVIDKTLHAIAVERHGLSTPLQKFRDLTSAIMTIWHSKTEIQKASLIYSNYIISLNEIEKDAKKVFQLITERLFDLYDITHTHCMMSEVSSMTQIFALLALAQGRNADDWDSDIYEDVSKVLSVKMDVESADLPVVMDRLAKTIVENGGDTNEILTNFVEQKPMDGFYWLSTHEKIIIPKTLSDFFEKHGHRCIAELDIMRKSWRSDPVPFVILLQSLVRNKIKYDDTRTNGPSVKVHRDDDALLNSLHTPLSSTAKRFLKFLLPYCRRAVWNREKTKSYLVRTGDQLKQAYELLADLMVKDYLLPDRQLLYFMSHQQIGQILDKHHSTPKILYKAMRKMKLLPELNKEEYPEITVGIREPVERDENLEFGDSITATPVSSGKVQATVKVCMSIEEASRVIEPGDILITHGTDIGWSPFFPILGGIVTELGGLISHGAVVAREYGLPCIVGAENATKIFKTGEQVVLDAGKGTITKVKMTL